MNVINVFGAPEKFMGDYGGSLTCRQVRVLAYTVVNPDKSTGDHAQALQMSKPAVTRASDRLVDLSLATKCKDPVDRRMVRIKATTSGAKLIADIILAARQ